MLNAQIQPLSIEPLAPVVPQTPSTLTAFGLHRQLVGKLVPVAVTLLVKLLTGWQTMVIAPQRPTNQRSDEQGRWAAGPKPAAAVKLRAAFHDGRQFSHDGLESRSIC